MKTTKLLLEVVSVLAIGGLTFTRPVTASCGKKSKAGPTRSTDQQTSAQAGMEGMQMNGDTPMRGGMEMGKEKAEDQGNAGRPATESMGTGDMSEMANEKQPQGEKPQAKKVLDPVCHMPVDPKLAEKSVYKGKTYYFCSKGDKEKFEQSPEKYVKQEKTN